MAEVHDRVVVQGNATTTVANTGTIEIGKGNPYHNALLELHRGLEFEQSTTLNARLVLLLANEIDDLERVKTIMQLARTLPQ